MLPRFSQALEATRASPTDRIKTKIKIADRNAALPYAAYVNGILRRDRNASHFVSRNLSNLFLTFFLERRAFDRAE